MGHAILASALVAVGFGAYLGVIHGVPGHVVGLAWALVGVVRFARFALALNGVDVTRLCSVLSVVAVTAIALGSWMWHLSPLVNHGVFTDRDVCSGAC